MLELLEHQNLTSISVTAVCETADVHRSTFYNYYTDPANLLEEIETDEMSADYLRLYIANGSVGLLREWVNEDFPVSSQKFAEMIYTLSRRVFQY